MPKHRITWIVMADGSRARIVTRRTEEPGFDVIAAFASSDAHAPSRELGADRPGRSRESAASAHHAIEPRHDLHGERKTAFIRSVAEHLNRAAAERAFHDLVLFAPPHCLGELRNRLDATTTHKIKATFPKDLTKLPIAELPAHLAAVALP